MPKRFADGKPGVVRASHDVAGAAQPHATAKRGAVHARHHRLRTPGKHLHHTGETARVGQVIRFGIGGGARHRAQVGAGAKRLALASQQNHASVRARRQRFERCGQFGNHQFIERIHHGATRQRYPRHAARIGAHLQRAIADRAAHAATTGSLATKVRIS